MGITLALASLGLDPYSRATQPTAFWASIAVYLMWTAMMGYFAFFKQW